MNKDAKVIFFGNVANNYFRIAEILVNHGYTNIQVLIADGESQTNLPISDGWDLQISKPFVNISEQWRIKALFFSRKSELRSKLREAEYLFLSSTNIFAALFTPRHVNKIFFATGADLSVFPFFWRNLYFRLHGKSKSILSISKALLTSLIVSISTRIAIQKIDTIYAYGFDPFRNALTKLGVSKKRISKTYLPVMLDSDKIKAALRITTDVGLDFLNRTSRANLVIFCPSRIMINSSYFHSITGQYKGQEKLLIAFAKFLSFSEVYSDSILVFINREDDIKDRLILERMIQELNLSRNVVWLVPTRDLFSRAELIEFYTISDAVFDEFGAGWFGSVSLEAMSCGVPVLCHLDESVMNNLYADNPFINFESESALIEVLQRMYLSKSFVQDRGKLSQNWIVENHSKRRVLEFFTHL